MTPGDVDRVVILCGGRGTRLRGHGPGHAHGRAHPPRARPPGRRDLRRHLRRRRGRRGSARPGRPPRRPRRPGHGDRRAAVAAVRRRRARRARLRVTGFHEKPRADHWINGGFFVFEPGVFEYLTPSSVLEREPLEGLAGDRRLHAFRHTGFWACMDTYKDAVALDDSWADGRAPWRTWP